MHSIAVSSLKIKRRTSFFFSRDSDCLQLKTQGSLFPSSELPNPHLCTRWAEAAFAKYKAQSTESEGTGGGYEGGTALPAGWGLAEGTAWWHNPRQCLWQGAGGVRGIWRHWGQLEANLAPRAGTAHLDRPRNQPKASSRLSIPSPPHPKARGKDNATHT